MKTIQLGIFLITWSTFSYAQKFESYEYLTLKQFMETKVKSDSNFVKQVYKNVKYPLNARKNKIQCEVEVMIINHRDQEMEVLVLNNELVFPNLRNELKRAIHNVDLKITKPFITRLKIAFSLEDYFYPKSRFKDYPFGLIDNEIFSVVGFIVPKISQQY